MDPGKDAKNSAVETNILMSIDFKIPFDCSANWVETLLEMKVTKRGARGLPRDLREWLGER